MWTKPYTGKYYRDIMTMCQRFSGFKIIWCLYYFIYKVGNYLSSAGLFFLKLKSARMSNEKYSIKMKRIKLKKVPSRPGC